MCCEYHDINEALCCYQHSDVCCATCPSSIPCRCDQTLFVHIGTLPTKAFCDSIGKGYPLVAIDLPPTNDDVIGQRFRAKILRPLDRQTEVEGRVVHVIRRASYFACYILPKQTPGSC